MRGFGSVGLSQDVTRLEEAYHSVYGKMCEYDSQIDSIYDFNGSLISFKKSTIPHIEETIGADDTNITLTCIANGYHAVYAADAIAYELQPTSFCAQYLQKIHRANGLVNSNLLFDPTFSEKRSIFWKHTFPIDRCCCTLRFCSWSPQFYLRPVFSFGHLRTK